MRLTKGISLNSPGDLREARHLKRRRKRRTDAENSSNNPITLGEYCKRGQYRQQHKVTMVLLTKLLSSCRRFVVGFERIKMTFIVVCHGGILNWCPTPYF